MVEFRTRKSEIIGDGGNHQEKLGLRRHSCTSQFTMADAAGVSHGPACNHPDTRSSRPIQASVPPDISYPLVSSTPFSSSSSMSLFLVHNPTIISEQQVKSSLSVSAFHDRESWRRLQHTPSTAYTEYSIQWVQHTPSTAYTEYSIHRVQHTPSTANTEYSTHRVQHTPSTASTQDCLSSIDSHD